jgi:membrane fusion protein, copper/silver efflux system
MRPTLICLLFLLLVLSCKEKPKANEHAKHLQMTSKAPDNTIMLTESQVRLANITTQEVTKRNLGATNVINGTLTADKHKSVGINSRAAGRIEKLFIKETGAAIRKGDPLYALYSESLLTMQQEYLLAKEQYEALGKTEKRYKSFFEAAERKLLLYGLSKVQINQIEKNSVVPGITFLSPASGIVTDIKAIEGQYVEEGTLLYNVEDVASLWVEAELYPAEVALVKPGDKVTVRIDGFESVEASVDFISPEYESNSQILLIRAKIENTGLQFKPGQQAQVLFTHSAKEAIAIPTDAVIRDGKGAHVYVQSGPAIFRPRMVETGAEGFDQVEITEGLSEGDTIAVTGAYLLYSEIILKQGGDPMAGHGHLGSANR